VRVRLSPFNPDDELMIVHEQGNKKAAAVATASEHLSRRSRLRRIKPKLRPSALGVGLGFPPALLIGRLKGPQAPDFFQNTLGIKLVLQALERAVDWLPFTNNYFWHGSLLASKKSAGPTGEAEPTRASGGRQLL
jgi:hypothetical protein